MRSVQYGIEKFVLRNMYLYAKILDAVINYGYQLTTKNKLTKCYRMIWYGYIR